MLINDFVNSSVLSVNHKTFLKTHNRKDLLSSKLSGKCKKGFPRNFRRSSTISEGQPQKYIR